MTERYTVGIDFGTESGRAVLVDCDDGRELATAVYPYRNGVVDQHLPPPDDDVVLEPDWALQDPDDYVRTLEHTVPELLRSTGVDPFRVIGVGIDFTVVHDAADGRRRHAALLAWTRSGASRTRGSSSGSTTRLSPRPNRINEVASARGARRGLRATAARSPPSGSSPRRCRSSTRRRRSTPAADRLIEAADWVVLQLTGVETRNACTAGYKAMWSKRDGFPCRGYFAAVDPRFADVVDEKMSRRIARSEREPAT